MKVLEEAKIWVGYVEKKSNNNLHDFTANAGSNNYTLFSEWYAQKGYGNYQAQPWCAIWVSYVIGHAYTDSERFAPHFSYCPYGVDQFKKLGVWHNTDPQAGDVIFFKNSKGEAGHVGFVLRTDDEYIYTVEGNTSAAAGVVDNGGCVAYKQYLRGEKKILGYARPNYPDRDELTSVNDIVWELGHRGIITDTGLWMAKLATDKNAYWLARKTANYIRLH